MGYTTIALLRDLVGMVQAGVPVAQEQQQQLDF